MGFETSVQAVRNTLLANNKMELIGLSMLP